MREIDGRIEENPLMYELDIILTVEYVLKSP